MSTRNFFLNNNANLIDPSIIYKGNKNSNKNRNEIQNFNMINSLQKGKVNYPLFTIPNIQKFITNNTNTNISTTQIKNKNGNEEEIDYSTLSIEKTISFHNQLNKEDEKKDDNKTFLNKKRKPNNKDEHLNYSDKDIKKIRIMIINSLTNFINGKIKTFFNNDIGKGIFIKQFLPINKTVLYHSSVEYDKEFLNKKLKEILSLISNKYTCYLSTKNKDLIDHLIHLEDKGKYFQELFELSFLDYIEYIRGTKKSELLNDLPNIDNILIQDGKIINEDELNIYKNIINKYEAIIEHKKTRDKKSKKSKNIHFKIN